jgi:hypothetical protein
VPPHLSVDPDGAMTSSYASGSVSLSNGTTWTEDGTIQDGGVDSDLVHMRYFGFFEALFV